jgi:hypothetical protein
MALACPSLKPLANLDAIGNMAPEVAPTGKRDAIMRLAAHEAARGAPGGTGKRNLACRRPTTTRKVNGSWQRKRIPRGQKLSFFRLSALVAMMAPKNTPTSHDAIIRPRAISWPATTTMISLRRRIWETKAWNPMPAKRKGLMEIFLPDEAIGRVSEMDIRAQAAS